MDRIPEILAVAAASHDLGRIYGKQDHHINSGIIIRKDRSLRAWFDSAQIELIAQAAEDHRASRLAEPRSIYGKIVSEADRLIDPALLSAGHLCTECHDTLNCLPPTR